MSAKKKVRLWVQLEDEPNEGSCGPSRGIPGGGYIRTDFPEFPSGPNEASLAMDEAEDEMFVALLRGNLDRYLPMIPAIVEDLRRDSKQNNEPRRSVPEAMKLWAHLLRLSPKYTEGVPSGNEQWVRDEQTRVLNEHGPDALRFWICFDGSWYDPRYWRNVSEIDPEEMARLWRNSGLVMEEDGRLRLPKDEEVN